MSEVYIHLNKDIYIFIYFFNNFHEVIVYQYINVLTCINFTKIYTYKYFVYSSVSQYLDFVFF